jgi:SH3 domain-containing protein
MKHLNVYGSTWAMFTLMVILISSGCGNIPSIPSTGSQPTASPAPMTSPVPSPVSAPESTPTAVPVTADTNVLFQDDFTNPATSWPEDKFDNYFIGYHEPEYYHIEITSPHSRTTVFEPQKTTYEDATIELEVLTVSAKTAVSGDFRYGLAFRRSGDQYYAFTISPRTKKWFALKSSPSELTVLAEGTDDNIHELDKDDSLRVDAQGSNFVFHINDEVVGEASDKDYASGETGFYVESFDSANTHIHFDKLVIRKLEMPDPESGGSTVIYQDDFTNPATNWPDRKFDNYFIGYHEPEYYHVEVTGPNYKTTVFEPQKRSFNDFTVDLQVMTVSKKTAATGDFRYGLAFRRSGDQYYAFTISPRTKKWFALKSSPTGLTVLTEGIDDSIHDLDNDDTLRVDAQGPNFFFHINDQLVGQATDPDYSSGEIGFYVESFDSANTHIHFDDLTIRDLNLSLVCTVNKGNVYVRSGPSKTYSQVALLSKDDTIKALGISPNHWIKIIVEGSSNPGWVSYLDGYMSCTPTVDLFPIVSP